MNPQTSMSDLPSHLLIDVMSRLPIKSIFHSRCVSRTWLNLLSGPEFVKRHLSRSTASLIINRHGNGRHDQSKLFKLFQLEDIHYDSAMISDYTSIDSDSVLLGSSNGLLLLNNLRNDSQNDSLYLCNPITREYITLPRAEGIRRYPNLVAHGFGYDSRNDKHKVIRIYQHHIIDDTKASLTHCRSEIQVYIIGSGSWRSVGHVNLDFGCRLPGIQLNGNLHWLTYDLERNEEFISSIDLDDESHKFHPLPPDVSEKTIRTLGVLDGCLCLCKNVTDFDFELWVMKEYGVKKSWSKQFVIREPSGHGIYYECVHALTVLKDGEILFRWDDTYLFSYNPENKSTKFIDFAGSSYQQCFEASIDVLSFLSLGNFEDEEVKKF